MLRVFVLCVGTLKEKYWREAAAEYCKRLSSFCKIEVIEVEEARVPEQPSPAQILMALDTEGKRLLSKLPPQAKAIALCIEGKEQSSVDFAKMLAKAQVEGVSSVALLIGGSWGLSEEVKARSTQKLSISPMTFPHQLARILLLEQLYRALSINAGGKYHK